MEEEAVSVLDTVEYAIINLVRSYPLLYDPQHPGHKDKSRRDMAWSEIARQLNREETWCYAKWRNLVDYYKKRRKAYETGAVKSGQKWAYYEALSFLDVYDNCRSDRDPIGFESEHSMSSIKSVNDQMFEEGPNHNDVNINHRFNYFDETQYHSLDGITERAHNPISRRNASEQGPSGSNNNNLVDPLSTDGPPPAKRQRDSGTVAVRHDFPTCKQASSTSDSDAPMTSQIPRILQVRSTRDASTGVVVQAPVPAPSRKTITTFTQDSEEMSNCPHYLFCMSLAARFRKMDPATATYTQMKMMEVLLKSEFPDEYKKRSDSNADT